MDLDDFLVLVGGGTKIKIIDMGDYDRDLLPGLPQAIKELGYTNKDEWSVDKYYNMVIKIKKEIVLYEGLNKECHYSYSLYRMWIPSDSVFIEGDTLVIYVMKYLRIKDIQDNLKDDECYYLDFINNASIYVCSNNIYIQRWSPKDCEYFGGLECKNDFDFDNYYLNSFTIEDYDSELIDLIAKEMLEECKYTLRERL